MLHPDQSLSDLALARPAASRVFRQLHLDCCRGGDRSLREARAERDLDPAAEHDERGRSRRGLREPAQDFVPPAVACTRWRAALLRGGQLEADVMGHAELESHLLAPRVLEGGA